MYEHLYLGPLHHHQNFHHSRHQPDHHQFQHWGNHEKSAPAEVKQSPKIQFSKTINGNL
jgi:hypothetical protein